MKPTRYTLEKIPKAVQTPYDDRSLSSEVYDRLVQAGTEDMRQKQTCGRKDMVVVVDDGVEAPPVDDTDWTYPSSPCETTAEMSEAEAEDRNVVELMAESGLEDVIGETEGQPSTDEGYGLGWSLDCGRLDRIKFGNRTLPQ
jgi:hypothetical protein